MRVNTEKRKPAMARMNQPLLQLLLAAQLLLVLAMLPCNTARAGVDPFEFQIYGYGTLKAGDFDPQLLNSYAAVGHSQGDGGLSSTYASQGMFRTALELEWGITDKVIFAYYLNLEKPADNTLQYAGSKFRFRGRFAEKDELPVDLGWYAEVAVWQPNVDSGRVELEVMPTFQKDIGDWTFILNAPDVSKVVVGPDAAVTVFEIGYRGEISYHFTQRTRFGLQVFGSPGDVGNATPMAQQQQYIFPVVHTHWPGDVRASIGIGFGLTPGSDLVMLKTNFNFGNGSGEADWD
jgi:hypothetical protein